MIERWTTWKVDGVGGVILQVSLALLDPATWEQVWEATASVGVDRAHFEVREWLREQAEQWLYIVGHQHELPLNQ